MRTGALLAASLLFGACSESVSDLPGSSHRDGGGGPTGALVAWGPTAALDGLACLGRDAAVSVGGGRAPYTWSVVDGVLPGGARLDTDGGPTAHVVIPPGPPGTFRFSLEARDARERAATIELTVRLRRGQALLPTWRDRPPPRRLEAIDLCGAPRSLDLPWSVFDAQWNGRWLTYLTAEDGGRVLHRVDLLAPSPTRERLGLVGANAVLLSSRGDVAFSLASDRMAIREAGSDARSVELEVVAAGRPPQISAHRHVAGRFLIRGFAPDGMGQVLDLSEREPRLLSFSDPETDASELNGVATGGYLRHRYGGDPVGDVVDLLGPNLDRQDTLPIAEITDIGPRGEVAAAVDTDGRLVLLRAGPDRLRRIPLSSSEAVPLEAGVVFRPVFSRSPTFGYAEHAPLGTLTWVLPPDGTARLGGLGGEPLEPPDWATPHARRRLADDLVVPTLDDGGTLALRRVDAAANPVGSPLPLYDGDGRWSTVTLSMDGRLAWVEVRDFDREPAYSATYLVDTRTGERLLEMPAARSVGFSDQGLAGWIHLEDGLDDRTVVFRFDPAADTLATKPLDDVRPLELRLN